MVNEPNVPHETIYEMQPNRLRIKEGIPFEAWERIGVTLMRLQASYPFWVGDWIRYGESAYGEMYAQAEALTKLTYGTLAQYKSVAERIPPDERKPELDFSHHRVVAKLEKTVRDRLLNEAVEGRLSVEQLKDKVGRELGIDKTFECPLCKQDGGEGKTRLELCVPCATALLQKGERQ